MSLLAFSGISEELGEKKLEGQIKMNKKEKVAQGLRQERMWT